MRRLGWVLALATGCGAGAAAAPGPTPPAVVAGPADPVTPAQRARWEAALAGQAVEPAEAARDLPALEALLASTDPALRDDLAYALLARWLLDPTLLTDADVAGLRDRLSARTAAVPTAGDAVFGRSFAALTLAAVAAREVERGAWTDAELDAQVAAAVAYAGREVDLRGHTGLAGWAHAAAHTADWLKFLGRHPRLSAAGATALLDGVVALAARRHGARFSHGEDERLAAAARAILRRGLLDDAAVDAWLGRLAQPLLEPPAAAFEPVGFATQRNARDVLVSLVAALWLDDAPAAAAALARVRALLTGG
ncbi:MAG: DUF2785 domain-containing protein [Kofleriaceae bacterium]